MQHPSNYQLSAHVWQANVFGLLCGTTKHNRCGRADVRIHMMHFTSKYVHSYVPNAFVRDSEPRRNHGVCHRAIVRVGIKHERAFSVCFCYSPVCVLPSARGSGTQWNRCLIDSLRPQRMSYVIYVWSKSSPWSSPRRLSCSSLSVCVSLQQRLHLKKKYFMSFCGHVPYSVKRDPLDQGLTEPNKKL